MRIVSEITVLHAGLRLGTLGPPLSCCVRQIKNTHLLWGRRKIILKWWVTLFYSAPKDIPSPASHHIDRAVYNLARHLYIYP